ncbi:MAG: PAS domain-containing protein [Verrucomicrobiaceae bacterium]|nr:PAS domain-containing protein [Verrucomicrobiaceae bacterium]
MLTEFLQDQAALYISGEMTPAERAEFDVLIDFHDELRGFVSDLAEVECALVVDRPQPDSNPSAAMKSRVLDLVRQHAHSTGPEARVVCDIEGRILWVNPAFTAMCGYSLDELRGRKPGSVLQGPETEPAAVERLRHAVRARERCEETMLNYHKNGGAYRVRIALSPVKDDSGALLWFTARERELKDAA